MDKDRRKNPNEKIRVFLFLDYLTHSEKCDILDTAIWFFRYAIYGFCV